MKQKMMFLTLMFMILSATSMKAQVSIGSLDNPHAGAVLDLSKVENAKLGLLLPQFPLQNVSDWQLSGSAGSAAVAWYRFLNSSNSGPGLRL
jgi:hypothetical protein